MSRAGKIFRWGGKVKEEEGVSRLGGVTGLS